MMTRSNIHVLIVIVAALVLTASQASAQILSSGQPDPAFNSNSMQLWLRGDSGITESGGNVSSWADQSTHGRDATQDTGANQPTTGKYNGTTITRDVVQFDSTAPNYLDTGYHFNDVFSGNFTILSLVSVDDATQEVAWFGVNGNGGATNHRLFTNSNGPLGRIDMFYKSGPGNQTINAPASPFTNPVDDMHLITWVVQGASNEVFVDGTNVSSMGGVDNSLFSGNTDPVYVGAGNLNNNPWLAFNGPIAELIVYGEALSASDRQAVEGYMLSYVPEPGSLVLLVLGVVGLISRRCRR